MVYTYEVASSIQSVSAAAQEGSLLAFSPAKLIIFIGWFYLCMYTATLIQGNQFISDGKRPYLCAAGLFLGPFIVFTLAVAETAVKLDRGEIELKDVLRSLLGLDDRAAAARVSASNGITLLDSAGRSFFEIYDTGGKNKKEKAQSIRTVENIILEALADRASDILIDPKTDGSYTIRFRVDGFLRVAMFPSVSWTRPQV